MQMMSLVRFFPPCGQKPAGRLQCPKDKRPGAGLESLAPGMLLGNLERDWDQGAEGGSASVRLRQGP